MPSVMFTTANGFANYWSGNLGGESIDLVLLGINLSNKEIETFRGHESTVRKLSLQRSFGFQKEGNERLFWTLIGNCSNLIHLHIDIKSVFFMDNLHWCCYRPPICQSLESLILGFCKVSEKAIALLAAAIEKGSVLREFGISSWEVKDADITPIILGDNSLEKFSLRYYDLGEAEVGALLLATRKRNQWKQLILRLYTPVHGFNLNIFTCSLRVASKSSAKIHLHSVTKPASLSEILNLKQMAFGDRVKF